GDSHIVDAFRWQLRMAPQELSYAVDDEVIRPRLGIHGTGLAEGGTHAIDKDHISKFARHTRILLISNNHGRCRAEAPGFLISPPSCDPDRGTRLRSQANYQTCTGSVSKLLAPALRVGWMVVPTRYQQSMVA